MHRIQKFILAQLTEHDSLRYTDMRPSSMEPSQFMYHLKLLISIGLVAKTVDGKYALSAEGKRYVDRADDSDLQLRPQPRIAAMIVFEHSGYGILYAQRSVQPAVGYIGFPLIDIPLGYQAPLKGFVSMQVEKRLGLGLNLEHRADGYINLYRSRELEGSLLAHVYCADTVSGTLKPHDSEFNYFWQRDLKDPKLLLSSVEYVLNQIKSHKDHFFFEYEFDLSD